MEEVDLDNLLYYIDEDNRTATVYRMIDRDYEGRVEIPQCIWDDGHMYEVREIADFAFDGCEGLESIEIPDGIYRIGDSSFCGCSELKEVELPESLQVLGGLWKPDFHQCRSQQQVFQRHRRCAVQQGPRYPH